MHEIDFDEVTTTEFQPAAIAEVFWEDEEEPSDGVPETIEHDAITEPTPRGQS